VRNENPPVTLMDYSMSYSHPADQTAAVAAALAELGISPAERVLITLPDGPGFADPRASRSRRRATDTDRGATGTLCSRAATALKRRVSKPE
jgi:hypothetical protein